MTIGQLARQAGVTPRTVRYYEEIGLLPAAPRSRSGYRHFGEAELLRLGQIRSLLGLGLTLAEVKDTLDSPRFCPGTLVAWHLRRVRRQLHDLERVEERLVRLQASVEAGHAPSAAQLTSLLKEIHIMENTAPLTLIIGSDLIPLCEGEAPLFNLIRQVRAELREQNVQLPGVRVHDSTPLAPSEFRLTLHDDAIAGGVLESPLLPALETALREAFERHSRALNLLTPES